MKFADAEKKHEDARLQAIYEVCWEILLGGAHKATKYVDDKMTVKATRKLYKGRWKPGEVIDIVLTIGKPNYEERANIKRARKMDQGPIEMTIKYPPKKK